MSYDNIKVELEQYKAWLVTLRERYQELLAERDVLKHQLTELREAAEAYRRDERNYARLDAVLDKLAKGKP